MFKTYTFLLEQTLRSAGEEIQRILRQNWSQYGNYRWVEKGIIRGWARAIIQRTGKRSSFRKSRYLETNSDSKGVRGGNRERRGSG